MDTEAPDPAHVWKAIDAYLGIAYEGPPPTLIRSLLETLRSWTGPVYTAPAFAATGSSNAPRRALRLGNRAYPHMKLVLEPSPDWTKYLFKADTHDRHICPAQSSTEYEAFQQLMQKNQETSEQIEAAWAEQGLPTFKTYLQEDLARRQAAAGRAAE